MRLPGNTRPGSWRWPVEPGVRVRDRVAVRLAVRREVVALDDAGEALADGRALHVHRLADLEDLDADLAADLQVGEFLRPRRGIPSARGPLRPPPWRGARRAASSRGSRGACRTRPARRRSRPCPAVLICVIRLSETSSTVTGWASPSSVKMRVMPTLRPTSPIVMTTSPLLCLTPALPEAPAPVGRPCTWYCVLTCAVTEP